MTDLSWDIREEIIEPSSSSLKSAQGSLVLVSTKSMIEAGSKRRGGGTRETDRTGSKGEGR